MPLIKGSSQKSFVKNLKTEMEHGKPQKQSLAIAYAMKRKAQRKKMAYGGETAEPNKGENLSQTASNFFSAAKSGSQQASNAPSQEQKNEAIRKQNQANMGYAKGGFISPKVSSLEEMLNKGSDESPVPDKYDYKLRPTQFDKSRVAYNESAMKEDDKDLNQRAVDMMASTSMSEEDLVDRIMEKRSKDFSGEARLAKGGYLEGKEMYPHAEGKMFDVTNKYSEGGKVANSDEIEAGFMPNEFDDLHLRDDLESTYGDDDNAGDALGDHQEDEDRKDIVARIMASRRKKDRLPNPA